MTNTTGFLYKRLSCPLVQYSEIFKKLILSSYEYQRVMSTIFLSGKICCRCLGAGAWSFVLQHSGWSDINKTRFPYPVSGFSIFTGLLKAFAETQRQAFSAGVLSRLTFTTRPKSHFYRHVQVRKNRFAVLTAIKSASWRM